MCRYVSECGLRWHIKNCTRPLAENNFICASVTHGSSLIVREFLSCLTFEEAAGIAKHFADTNQREGALSLSNSILKWCVVPRKVRIARGIQFLADLDSVPSGTRAQFVEQEVNVCHIVMLTATPGSDASNTILQRLDEIVESRLATLSPVSQTRVLRIRGMTLVGFFPSLRPSVEQQKKGAVLLRKVSDM